MKFVRKALKKNNHKQNKQQLNKWASTLKYIKTVKVRLKKFVI